MIYNDPNIHTIFMHHPPTFKQIEDYEAIRKAAEDFTKAIVLHTPSCADQSAAIRHVRDAMMTANAAIALDGMI